ncbi:MAG TPA: MlaD family protein [Candidatus Ozemobacteraceae bacterium]|nr:MlaD family protein [Candidatus Ozemobacteraceae bacterium]
MNSTFKVGIITLIATFMLVYMAFIIGDIQLTERGYRFIVTFYSVNGLNSGASVSMAGVKIGKVEKIEIRDDQVYVHCYIRELRYRIRNRNTFTIGTAGLMGEKYVEIVPTRDQTSPYVENANVVEGTDPTRMEELFDQGNELLKKLQSLAASAKDVVGDPELKQSTRAIFKNAETASKNVNNIIESVKGRTDKIVEHLENVLRKVDEEVDANRQSIRDIVENMKDFSKRIGEISSENRESLKEIVENIRNVSDRLDDMIAELNKDKKLTEDVKSTVDSLRKASDNAKEITREVKEIVIDKDIRGKIKTGLDDAHKLAQAVDKVFLNIKQTKIDFKYLLRYNKEEDVFFSDIMVDIWPSEKSFYRVGVEDIGGDPLFNLMVARDPQQRLIKRAGVISSKVGVGVDYQWAQDITYSLDVIDTRDPTVRFTSGYAIRPGLKFQLRVDDISDEKDVNFAIEYKF